MANRRWPIIHSRKHNLGTDRVTPTGASASQTLADSLGANRTVLNAKWKTLRRWRAARAKVQNGEARARIVFFGDSTGFGTGAGTGASGRDGARPKSYPARVAEYLSVLGIPAINQSVMGTSDRISDLPTYDTRIVNGGWTSGQASFGGAGFTSNVLNTKFSFTPDINIDRAEIYYLAAPIYTNRYFNIDFDAGAATVVNMLDAVAASVKKQTLTTTLGAHTFNVTKTDSPAAAIWQGLICWDSTKPAVDVINISWSGSNTADWVATTKPNLVNPAHATINNFPVLAADLIVINLAINDRQPGATNVPVETYRANVQLMITNAKATGADVLLVDPLPSNTAVVTAAVQATYSQVLADLAVANDIPLLSMPEIVGLYADTSALGMMYDDLHGKGSIYSIEARAIANLLAA